MKTGRIYRITQQSHDPDNDIQEVVDISDMDYLIEDDQDTEIITLEPGPNPIKYKIVDNEEDPFTVLRGQRLTLEINTDNPIELSTFASGSDQRWHVHHYIGANTIYLGWLVLDDLNIAFMPDPNVLVLTATDGFGGLSELPLTDADGNNPVGDYKIIELLKMAFDGTGHTLGFKVAFNIKNAGFIDDISIPNANDQHFFSLNYLNAKTFEDKIGTCVSRRDVIETILGEEAFAVQRQGYIWIIRVDEIEQARGLYITEWDADGVFVGNLGEQDFNKDVGAESPYTIYFSKEETKVFGERPKKFIKLTYPYETPIEIVENIDFERGELNTTVSATERLYDIADWSLFNYDGNSLEAPGTSAYIRRIFENDYEKQRYVVVVPGTQQDYYLVSSRIPVGQKGRFEFNVDHSHDASGARTGGQFTATIAQLRLYGADGTYYTFEGGTALNQDRSWVACNSDFSTNQKYFWIEGDGSEDDTEWRSVSQYGTIVDTTIPKAGYIIIILRANFETDTYETRFSNLRFDYTPYINGSYAKYTAQTQTVTQDGNYKAKREKDIKMCESPEMGLKGALLKGLLFNEIFSGSVEFTDSNSFKISGYQLFLFRKGQRLNISGTTSNNIAETRVKNVTYHALPDETVIEIEATTTSETDGSTSVKELSFELSSEFYNAATAPDGPPDDNYIHPYSEIQAYDVFNQFNYDKRIFHATLQGLDLAALDGDLERNNAHVVHKWFFQDATNDTANRMFQLLTFDQDHRTGEWTGVFREVFNLLRQKVYVGREFKYEQ